MMRTKRHVKRGPVADTLAGLVDNVMAVGLALGLLLGCTFVAISAPLWIRTLLTPDHPSARSLPSYPNAEQVMRRYLTTEEARQMGDSVVSGEALIFRTRDAPEVVFTFYRNILHREGWVSVSNKENSYRLPIGTYGGTDVGPIEIAVTAENVSSGITNAKVILAVSNGLCC
jgi:hypothetical protein